MIVSRDAKLKHSFLIPGTSSFDFHCLLSTKNHADRIVSALLPSLSHPHIKPFTPILDFCVVP